MSALIRVTLSQTELQIEPGQKGELSVTVQNLSEIVDQYAVEVEGLDTAWFTVSPPRIPSSRKTKARYGSRCTHRPLPEQAHTTSP